MKIRLRMAQAICLAIVLAFFLAFTAYASTSYQVAHSFYASAKAKKYFYCDDDPQWKDLSPKYLLKFSSDSEAKAKTGMVLHRPCRD